MGVKLAVGNTFKTVDTCLPGLALTGHILHSTVNSFWPVANWSKRILDIDIKVKCIALIVHGSTFIKADTKVSVAHPKSAAILTNINFISRRKKTLKI